MQVMHEFTWRVSATLPGRLVPGRANLLGMEHAVDRVA